MNPTLALVGTGRFNLTACGSSKLTCRIHCTIGQSSSCYGETPTGRRVGVASVRHDTLVYTYEENYHELAVFIDLSADSFDPVASRTYRFPVSQIGMTKHTTTP
jgi:hypothetical protein